MKYIFDIPDNVDYGVLTCRTSNGYYEYNFDGADLKQLPPAQPERPEPKRGEWLERDVIDEPKGKHITQWQSARCSVCGRYHTTPYLYSFTHYNFCPKCGAEMEVTT